MEKRNLYLITAVIIVVLAIGGIIYVLPMLTPAPQKPTLQLWTSFGGENATLRLFQNVSDAFYNETGITVVPTFYSTDDLNTKLSTSLSAGSPPDIFVVYPGGQLNTYVKEGALANITDLFQESWAQSQIPASIKSAVSVNGSQYALPYEETSDYMLVNTKLFDAYGISVPTFDSGWTWDQFIQACNTWKAHGVTPMAMSGADGWTVDLVDEYINQRLNGVNAFENALARTQSFESSFDAAYTKIQQFCNSDYFQPGWETQGYMDAYALFSSGKAAIWVQGTWAVGMTPDTDNMTQDVVPFPYFSENPGAKNVIFGESTNFAIASASKYKTEAEEFLAFLSLPEWQVKYVQVTGNMLAQNIVIPQGVYPALITKIAGVLAKPDSIVVTRYVSQCNPDFGAFMEQENGLVSASQATPAAAAAALEAKAVQLLGPVH